MDPIHIACTIDANFIQHLGVMLCSLFENNKHHHFTIHSIVDFERNQEYSKLEQLITGYRHTLNTIITDGKEVEKLKIAAHFTKAVYYRLSLPDLIDPQLNKVLFLDSDIIVRKDIADVWNIDISTYAVAAIQEGIFKRYTQLDLSERKIYFNAGVMLINLEYWRKNKVKEKTINFILKNPEKLAYPDQDGLNVVLQDKWLELPLIWNTQTIIFDDINSAHKIRKDWLEEAKQDPAIVHYTGRLKPWHFYCEHPYAQEYYYYRALTEWKNTKLPQQKLQNLFKQNMKRLLNFLYRKDKYKIYKRSNKQTS